MYNSQFKSRLDTMRAGEKVVYFTGLLMRDRKFNKDLNLLANTVWYASGMRWNANAKPAAKEDHQGQWQPTGERRVILTQRKLSEPLGYEYIAIKI